FAAAQGHAPNAVRLALAAPAIEQLDVALRILADLLNATDEDFDSTE
ncbi:MAG: PLP-dependent aminotransferase family protein, partial [Rhizomicrobium sp.]